MWCHFSTNWQKNVDSELTMEGIARAVSQQQFQCFSVRKIKFDQISSHATRDAEELGLQR